MGLALAPIFLSLISTTPKRLGPQRVGVAVGFQVGAASPGIALLPGLAGLLAERLDGHPRDVQLADHLRGRPMGGRAAVGAPAGPRVRAPAD